MHVQRTSGMVVGVFGLPCSGKTTVVKTLVESSRELIAYISTGDIARRLATEQDTQHMAVGGLYPHEAPLRAELLKTIEARQRSGAEIVIVDGFPRFDDQVQWMLDNQLAGVGSGCLIQVQGDDLIKRAQCRARDAFDDPQVFIKRAEKQAAEITKMEQIIFRVGIPYYTVNNTELSVAVAELAKRLGVRK